eukprot:scaffold1506_cov302-Prasinococcus_capsulatus_cf.AAC.2
MADRCAIAGSGGRSRPRAGPPLARARGGRRRPASHAGGGEGGGGGGGGAGGGDVRVEGGPGRREMLAPRSAADRSRPPPDGAAAAVAAPAAAAGAGAGAGERIGKGRRGEEEAYLRPARAEPRVGGGAGARGVRPAWHRRRPRAAQRQLGRRAAPRRADNGTGVACRRLERAPCARPRRRGEERRRGQDAPRSRRASQDKRSRGANQRAASGLRAERNTPAAGRRRRYFAPHCTCRSPRAPRVRAAAPPPLQLAWPAGTETLMG